MRILIYILLLLIPKTYAVNYFDFNPQTYLIGWDNIVEIEARYVFKNYSEEEFFIRPVLSQGVAFIYDEKKDIWVSAADLWTQMPILSKVIKLKLFAANSTDLSFNILNTHTGEIYESSKKTYYPYSVLVTYIKKIKLR